ncbi:MAG: MBL fold metallo-hydrolase [Oscillospiraceae bacterium]|nr:MBL fold metallo-hydrolase [Oscillospiraceae bacterium]
MAKKKKQPSMAKYSWLVALAIIVLWGIYMLFGGGMDRYQDPAPSVGEEPDFRVLFIDVGQADAALIFCEGETMLIDGGNAEDSNLIYTVLGKYDVEHLDYVICTHAHEDHVGGLSGALQACTVDTVYCPVTSYSSKVFTNFADKVAERGAEITVPAAGDVFYLGSAVGEILACDPDAGDTNNTSIVLKLTYGETSFLFTADAEHTVENDLLDEGTDLSATVLKVGHHGSNTSTGEDFLRAVDPDYAIISCGKNNSYGHPNEETLVLLDQYDVPVYRTDELGDILCTSDGKTVTVEAVN